MARGSIEFYGNSVPSDDFLEDAISGLALEQKELPPKYFYDARGSELFEDICVLPEYYPTRSEVALTETHVEEIVRFAVDGSPAGVELIEYGSGASTKTRILIGRLRPLAYIPVDISTSALRGAATQLAAEFPWLDIRAVTGDFGRPLAIPAFGGDGRKVVYFPGSTIGNLTREDAQAFLRMTRGQLGPGGAMLVGVDLKKDPNILHAAYNDAQGVTAQFNLNLLHRINHELGGNFAIDRFAHYAFYNAAMGRVEMHLASLAPQSVDIGRHRFSFGAGETIHTENSCKYEIEEFQELAEQAGFRGEAVWTDADRLFSLHGLVAA
jgi:dimethylhistidine N-methyltransferase